MSGLREFEEEIARTTDPDTRVRLLKIYDKLKQERKEVREVLQRAYDQMKQGGKEYTEEGGKNKQLTPFNEQKPVFTEGRTPRSILKQITPLGVLMIITIIIILGMILYVFFPSSFPDK